VDERNRPQRTLPRQGRLPRPDPLETHVIDTSASWRPAPTSTPRPDVADAVVMDGVTVSFPDQLAVDNLSLVVPAGAILGLIGPSGAGKTTTIRVLTGALDPTSGTVRVLGEEPRHFFRQTRERIGYMPQSFTLYPDLTVRENVDFVGSLFGMFFGSRRRRTKEVLGLVDLWDVRGRRAGQLSGGMQRRLELACALVHEPALLFLDEPTAGIDPILRGRIWEELHRLRDAGRTLIVTTQYVNEAESCDRVALIANGRLLALATPDGLRREAVGGDVVVVETAAFFDADQLSELPYVRRVRQDGARQVTVVVDDAATALPDVVEAVRTRGGEVASAREERPSFDDVFAALVKRDEERLRSEAAVADEETAGPAKDVDAATDGRAQADGVLTDANAVAPPLAPDPTADAVDAQWRVDEPGRVGPTGGPTADLAPDPTREEPR
jgi:ABC-2 type transport system ATP-binding protein